LFLAALWQDAFIVHLDFTGFLRVDAVDYSRLSLLEARYHFDRADIALQWQHMSGDATSNFGASLQQTIWQAIVTIFF
jgi:hypothetical protein